MFDGRTSSFRRLSLQDSLLHICHQLPPAPIVNHLPYQGSYQLGSFCALASPWSGSPTQSPSDLSWRPRLAPAMPSPGDLTAIGSLSLLIWKQSTFIVCNVFNVCWRNIYEWYVQRNSRLRETSHSYTTLQISSKKREKSGIFCIFFYWGEIHWIGSFFHSGNAAILNLMVMITWETFWQFSSHFVK